MWLHSVLGRGRGQKWGGGWWILSCVLVTPGDFWMGPRTRVWDSANLSSVTLLPWVLEALTSSFFLLFLPKEEPAAIWPWLHLGWNLGGTQRKAAKCACRDPSEAAAPLKHPRLQRLPRLAARSALWPHTSDWLSPSWGGRWQLCALGPPPPLCHPDGHGGLPAPSCSWQTRRNEMGVMKQEVSLSVYAATLLGHSSSFERSQTTEWHADGDKT